MLLNRSKWFRLTFLPRLLPRLQSAVPPLNEDGRRRESREPLQQQWRQQQEQQLAR
jgi:hypothetical protein